MKRILISMLALLLCVCMLSACDAAEENPTEAPTVAPTEAPTSTNNEKETVTSSDTDFIEAKIFDKSKIDSSLTLNEAFALFGQPNPYTVSRDYPMFYNWSISDDEILYITFETDNREDFLQKLKDGYFKLSEETRHYTKEGYPIQTENEMKVFKEWIDNHKATSAYIIKNGQTEVLLPSE